MADFGAQLREARERKGISLRQIAAATKISIAALEALERNDISRLPGGIFSRAFVRSYAIEVGLDPDETVRKFLAHFSGETDPVSGSQASAIVPSAQAGVIHAAAVGTPQAPSADARALKSTLPRSTPATPEGVTEETEFESRQRMAGVVLKLAIISLPIALTIVYLNSRVAAPTPHDDAASEMEAAEPSAAPSPEVALEARSPETPTSGAVGPASPAVERAPAAPQASGVTIEIAPTAECWVQLTTDGTVALSRVLLAGERESHRFARFAVLQVGDAAACAFFINGRAARPLGRPRQVREVTITTDNYASFLAPGERPPGQ